MTQLIENNHLKRFSFFSNSSLTSQNNLLKMPLWMTSVPNSYWLANWKSVLFHYLTYWLKKNHQRFTIPWRIKCRFLCYTLSHLCGLTLTIPVNVLLSLPQKILSPQPSTSASPHSCTQPQFALECHPNPIYCTAAYLTAISWSKTRTVTSPPKGCPWPSWFTAVKLL
jgi:hypothetical protein